MAVSLSLSINQNSRNVDANTSSITVKVIASYTYGSYNRNQCSGSLTIDGETYSFTSSFNASQATSGSETIYTKTVNVEHDNDGSKTVSCSASFITGVSSGTIRASASKELVVIPRQATITAAPNFTDEDNPTISFNNPAGNSVDWLEACISLDGSKDDVQYRTITNKTGSSYTIQLTTAERNTLRNSIPNDKSRKVRFYIQTTIGSNEYRNYIEKTFSIVNANPTFNPTIVDTNATTIALTGDSSKLIRYFSNAKITTGAAAIKGATLESQKTVSGSKSFTTATGTINAIESSSIVLSATDSRGNSASQTVKPNMINYVKLTCNFGKSTPDTSGNFTLNITGNYFNSSFGAVNNTLAVKYRYKASGGEFGEWKELTPSLSGNSYTATDNLSGLDYQTTYIFEAEAADKLTTISTGDRDIKSLPVFDWSGEDFAFHVPVYLDNYRQVYSKSTDGDNVMLMSLNNQNQSFFGYGGYSMELGSTYFDGNSVYVRSKNAISMTATGTIGGNKAWTNSSDSRLKKNIEDIPQVYLDIWMELEPKVFEWNTDNQKQFGLIAQDVIDVCKKYGVDYKTLGFISTMEIDGVEYLALTYEHYHMLTAQVLKNTVNELSSLKSELQEIKALL